MEISAAYESALLAQMAYADNLNDNKSDELLTNALIHETNGASDVTQAQAEYFASKYVVVQQTNNPETGNPETGFSATLFQEIETGEYHLATRGAAPINPFDPDWNDANLDNLKYGMSFKQVTDLLNFYFRLTSSSDEVIEKAGNADTIISSVSFTLSSAQKYNIKILQLADPQQGTLFYSSKKYLFNQKLNRTNFLANANSQKKLTAYLTG